jgi:hypothetical protein
MSYDPDPGRRRKRGKGKRSRVPPQLRAWVYGRRKKRYDPGRRSIAYGYGTIRGKPYRIGARGGVAWTGGRKPRYDPERRRFGRIRRYGGKFESFINRHAGKLGFLVGLGFGVGSGYSNVANAVGGEQAPARYFDLVKSEFTHLYSTSGKWNPISYLKYKFLGIHPETEQQVGSAWVAPFWASLIGWIISKFHVLPPRINKPLNNFCKGALAASTIGALVLPGTTVSDVVNAGSTTHTSTTFPTTTPQEMNYWR